MVYGFLSPCPWGGAAPIAVAFFICSQSPVGMHHRFCFYHRLRGVEVDSDGSLLATRLALSRFFELPLLLLVADAFSTLRQCPDAPRAQGGPLFVAVGGANLARR